MSKFTQMSRSLSMTLISMTSRHSRVQPMYSLKEDVIYVISSLHLLHTRELFTHTSVS